MMYLNKVDTNFTKATLDLTETYDVFKSIQTNSPVV